MKLYLVQHGEALEKDVDPARPLTDRGRAEVERVAAFLGGAGVRVAQVLHSGKLRAEQTAEVLAPAVGAAGRVEKTGDIDPLDPPLAFELTVNEWTEDTMVVGHLPFMGKLVSRPSDRGVQSGGRGLSGERRRQHVARRLDDPPGPGEPVRNEA